MNDERAQSPDEESEAAPTEPRESPSGDAPTGDAASEAHADPGEPGEPDGPGDAAAPEEAAELAEPAERPEPAGAPAALAEPSGAPGEGGDQIEWRPVVTGETIEWQPVMSAAGEEPARREPASSEPASSEPQFTEPEFDEQAWEEALAADPVDAPAGEVLPESRPGVAAHPAGGVRKAPPPPPPSGPGGPTGPTGDAAPQKAKRQIVILSALTALVVVVAVVGFVLSQGATKKGSSATGPGVTTSVKPATGGTTVPPTELTMYKDDQTGFSIRYPKAWNKYVPPVSDIRLVLQSSQNDGVSIRILPIQTVATQENIGNFKAVTDAIVFGDQGNKLIQEQLVLLNGKLTYYYLYTFQDKDSGQQGLHAHYFVFEGLRMMSMVFQSLPADDFTRQAAVFDQVAESFTVDPAPPGATAVPVPATTTTVN